MNSRMKHIKLLTIITLLSTSIAVQGQVKLTGSCGTVFTQESIDVLKSNIKHSSEDRIEMRSGIPRYVPVTFHFIADDNGKGYPREEQALEQLASINELFAPQEMIFYLDEIKYKADSRIYTAPASSPAEFQMRLIKDQNAMNIYVTQNADTGGSDVGMTLGYYSPSNDWLVIRKDQFNGASGTLGHEIGHFFSLAHPYNGWECDPYDIDVHGKQVTILWSPCNGSLRVELQDGSNCSISGDLICDTPPDYEFGLGWSVGGDRCAVYDAGTMDFNGDIIDPMETNVMGNFIACDAYFFSNTQKNIVRADYQSSRRSYLRTGVVPNTDEVVDEVVYNYPINDNESPTDTQIEFDWEDVPGANQYLFIVDRFSTFSAAPQRIVMSESHVVVEELPLGAKFYWKVWPFNESQTGAGWSATQSFFVGSSTAVNEISSVEEFDVYPNPVTDGSLVVAIRSTESFDAELRLLNMSGKIMQHVSGLQVIADDQWSLELNADELMAGLYIVQIISDKGILTSKFAVQ